MKKMTLSLLGILCFSMLWGQAFPCLDQFYISLNDYSAPSDIYQIKSDGVTAEFDFRFSVPHRISAIGFNPVDRHIYGVELETNRVIKMDAAGNLTTVGLATGIGSEWVALSGDCSPTGKYVVKQRTNNRLYIFNVIGTFTQEVEVQLMWHPSSGNTGVADVDMDDFIFDPFQPNVLYTYQRGNWEDEPVATRNHLLRIDMDPNSPTFGNVFVVVEIPSDVINLLAAFFFNSRGELFGYGALTGPPYRQNRFVKIDKNTGETNLVGIGPVASGTDGCSCPYTVVATKEVENIVPLCEEAIVDYRITIKNNALEDLSDLTFRDELPAGATVIDVFPPDPFGRLASPGSGVGTSDLIYNNIDLVEGDSISFLLTVSVPLGPPTFSNQFTLESIPSFLGNTILSDDPTTITPRDSTVVNLPATVGMVEREEVTTICTGSSYEINGMLLTDPGVYEFLLESEDPTACDTLLSVELLVEEDIQQTNWIDICAGETYTIYDSTLTASGTYVFALPASTSYACDTLVTVQLTEHQAGRKDTLVCILEGKEFKYYDMTIDAAGVYEYILPIPNTQACDSIVRIKVEVLPEGSAFYIPNAFSPGTPDGINDYLTIYPGPAIVRLERFMIFNRWGGKVYELYDQPFQSPIHTWDGRMNGAFVEEEVFVYLLEVIGKDGSRHTHAGSIVLF